MFSIMEEVCSIFVSSFDWSSKILCSKLSILVSMLSDINSSLQHKVSLALGINVLCCLWRLAQKVTKLDSKVSLSHENFHFLRSGQLSSRGLAIQPRSDICLAKRSEARHSDRGWTVQIKEKCKFSRQRRAKSFDHRMSKRSEAAQMHFFCCLSIMIPKKGGQRSIMTSMRLPSKE